MYICEIRKFNWFSEPKQLKPKAKPGFKKVSPTCVFLSTPSLCSREKKKDTVNVMP